MTMHKKIFSCLTAIFAVFMLSHTSSAQKLHPQYIYCKVDFQFSRQVKGWKVNMFVDYGQADTVKIQQDGGLYK